MKKVIFHKIGVQNFLSFGNEMTFLEYKKGLNFVTGTNLDLNSKNGVGKTTLLVEALSFALFGETFRNINNKNVINNKTRGECIVQLWFSVNGVHYEVTRSLAPSKLFLRKIVDGNKSDVDETRTIPETNKDILDLLGMTKQVFTNTLVMTNGDSVSFLNQKPATLKTKFIEGILSLEYFTKMFETANDGLKAVSKEYTALSAKVTEIAESITSDKRYRDQEDIKIRTNIETIQTQLDKQKEARVVVDQGENIEKLENDIKGIETEIEDLNDKTNKLQLKESKERAQYAVKKSELDGHNCVKFECPTCKRAYDSDVKKEDIEAAKEKVKEEMAVIKAMLDKIAEAHIKVRSAISGKKSLKSKGESDIRECRAIQTEYNNVANEISRLERNLADAKLKTNPFNTKIEEGEIKLEERKAELVAIAKEVTIQEAVKFVTSPQGAKTYAVKKIIGTLNNRLDFYLQRLNLPFTIAFDEFFEETLTNAKKVDMTYANLSGGERKRVDFALLFAFRDIRRLQSNVSINLSVFDELLDSSLDESGMVSIMALLDEMVKTSDDAYYIITHRPSNVEAEGYNTILLEKKNDITSVVS